MKVLFVALQAADVATTWWGLNHGAREINPIIASGGILALIGSKIVVMLILLFPRKFVIFANVFTALVVMWNLFVIGWKL